MTNRKVLPFFCDECGAELSTGHVCPECRRVLCHKHHYGGTSGLLRRRDGLCVKCAEAKAKVSNEKAEQA